MGKTQKWRDGDKSSREFIIKIMDYQYKFINYVGVYVQTTFLMGSKFMVNRIEPVIVSRERQSRQQSRDAEQPIVESRIRSTGGTGFRESR